MENKKKQELFQLAMTIGIYLAIALLLLAIIVIAKNVKEIKTDPIPYGIEKKGFKVCSCYDMNGNSYDYDATGFIPKRSNGWNIQFD